MNQNFINQIINDDCLNILSKIEKNSIDLILTDPPYLISKVSHYTESNKVSKYNKLSIDFGEWDKDYVDMDLLFSEYKRILKQGGVLIFFYDIWKSNLIKELGEKYKFTQPRVCQWIKNNPTPINSNINYLSNAVEYFFTFTKGRNATFNSSYDKGIYNFSKCGKGKTEHPTEKPVDLFKSLIEKHSNINDIVLDTFGGSGTTAVAAIETNRNYILIEKEENYVEISNQRIKLIGN